jgi:hypothetical protein
MQAVRAKVAAIVLLAVAVLFGSTTFSNAAPAQYPPKPESTFSPAPQAPEFSALAQSITRGYTLFSFNKKFKLVPNSINIAKSTLSATSNKVTVKLKTTTIVNSILQQSKISKVTASGSGFKPNTSVSIFILSPLTYVATSKVGAKGQFTKSAFISAKIKKGIYKIQVVGRSVKGLKTSATNTIRLVR